MVTTHPASLDADCTHMESNFHTVHGEWECVCQSVHIELASL